MFVDRVDAGVHLAEELNAKPVIAEATPSDLLVLSIPRGGVVVGQAVAQGLGCTHDVIVVRKIGFPSYDELAVGAVAEDGPIFLNNAMLAQNQLNEADLTAQVLRARSRVSHYIHLFRANKPLELADKLVILVDDGVATGETMKAAIRWVESRRETSAIRGVLVAVPVCSLAVSGDMAKLVDDFVCLYTPRRFYAVGQFYRQFEQVSDREVLALLYSQQHTDVPSDG